MWNARIVIDEFDAKLKLDTNNHENVYEKLHEKISEFLNEITGDKPCGFDILDIKEMKCENCYEFCSGTRNPNTGWCSQEEKEVDCNGYCCDFC